MSDLPETFELPSTFELREYPDVDTLETIWRNEMIIPYDQLRLRNYEKEVREGCVHVIYERKTFNNVYYGRYFPHNDKVLWATYQWRPIRAALFGRGHLDVDIVNCHPTLAAQLYTKLTGKTATAVEEYVKNRDEIINQMYISPDAITRYNKQAQDCLTKKDFVKYLFTMTLYGDNVDTWERHFNLYPDDYELPEIYKRFAEDVTRIRTEVARTEDPYYAEMRKNITVDKGKFEAHKFLSLVLQDLEAYIVYTMIQQAQKDGYEVTSYMYDGFIIKADSLPPGYLESLEKAVLDLWDYRVKLTIKPFDRSIDLTKLPVPSIYRDDDRDYSSLKTIFTSIDEFDTYIRSVFALIDTGSKSYWVVKGIDDQTRAVEYQRIKTNSKEELNFKRKKYTLADDTEFTLLDRMRTLAPILSYPEEGFEPYLQFTPIDIFNAFTGFKHAFRTGEPTPKGLEGLEAFKKHILEVWAAGNDKNAAYIFKWLAHIIQRPTERMGTALLIKSHQGAGKNVITEFLAKYVIGDKYYCYIDNITDLFARFNSYLAHKLFTVVDGTYTSEMKKKEISDRLKSTITRTYMNVKYKGVKPMLINDYNNYIFLTNHDDALLIEERDRMFAIFECSNHLCGHIDDYFEPFVAKLYNDEAGYAVFKWLAEYDLTGFDPKGELPKTELKNDMKIYSLPYSVHMIIEALRGEYEVNWNIDRNGKICMPTSCLYNYYRDWCVKSGVSPYSGMTEFGYHMNRILKTTHKIIRGIKKSGWFDVTLDELKKIMCDYIEIPDLFEEPEE